MPKKNAHAKIESSPLIKVVPIGVATLAILRGWSLEVDPSFLTLFGVHTGLRPLSGCLVVIDVG